MLATSATISSTSHIINTNLILIAGHVAWDEETS